MIDGHDERHGHEVEELGRAEGQLKLARDVGDVATAGPHQGDAQPDAARGERDDEAGDVQARHQEGVDESEEAAREQGHEHGHDHGEGQVGVLAR